MDVFVTHLKPSETIRPPAEKPVIPLPVECVWTILCNFNQVKRSENPEHMEAASGKSAGGRDGMGGKAGREGV